MSFIFIISYSCGNSEAQEDEMTIPSFLLQSFLEPLLCDMPYPRSLHMLLNVVYYSLTPGSVWAILELQAKGKASNTNPTKMLFILILGVLVPFKFDAWGKHLSHLAVVLALRITPWGRYYPHHVIGKEISVQGY